MNISDEIERFLLELIEDCNTVSFSRSDVAKHFSVVPSQINYVLETRFGLDRGFVIESQRGGGGFITITKIEGDRSSILSDIVENNIGSEIDFQKCERITKRLRSEDIISDREKELILCAVSDKALLVSSGNRNALRASIFKSFILYLLKRNN